ncbi:MAG: hypothetical protein ACAI38_23080 [Myxococcota bacterium]
MALEVIAAGTSVRESSGVSTGAQPRSGSAILATALAAPIQTAELNIGIQLFGSPHYHRPHGPRRDRDRDGIPDRHDRDRDNDGIPNRWDPNPNRPNYPVPMPPPYHRFDRPCRPYERPDFYNRFGQPRCY